MRMEPVRSDLRWHNLPTMSSCALAQTGETAHGGWFKSCSICNANARAQVHRTSTHKAPDECGHTGTPYALKCVKHENAVDYARVASGLDYVPA